jgi:bifunctional UDP-N-acetylglucosamine pyrophosphorylase/glucosamine-1-phosphate N-acetyltransferase
MVESVVRSVLATGIDIIVVVVGHQGTEVKAAVRPFIEVTCVEQKERRGTGHAVQQALPFLRGTWAETYVVLTGDTPLLRPQTIHALADGHDASGCAATVLTAEFADPTGYGRIVRDGSGRLEAIVEEKDAAPEIRALREINSGIYAFDAEALAEALTHITDENAQREYYLTDTIAILRRAGRPVAAVAAADPSEVHGINTVEQLTEADRLYRERWPAGRDWTQAG